MLDWRIEADIERVGPDLSGEQYDIFSSAFNSPVAYRPGTGEIHVVFRLRGFLTMDAAIAAGKSQIREALAEAHVSRASIRNFRVHKVSSEREM